MLDIFYSNKYDNKTAVINNKKEYSFSDLKKIISANIQIIKNKKDNVVILGVDNFSFIINFFASIFLNKNIFLISDIKKLDYFDLDYDLLDCISLNKKEDFQFNKIEAEKVIINFFTSGSTSKPKIIKKSLFNLIQEGLDTGEEFDFKNKNYKVISTTTMSHLFGMTFHLMASLNNGLIIDCDKISYPENVDSDNAILVSTPSFLSSVLKYDISFKIVPKYIISAGSKLQDEVFKYFENITNVIEIYGSTESGVIAHKEHYSDDLTLFKNVKVEVREDCADVFSNYLYGENATINDKIELLDNKIKFKNRTDRLFKIQEKRISANELEHKLKQNEFVKNCYIFKKEEKLACLCAINDFGKDFLIKNDYIKLIKILKNYMLKFSEIIPQKWKIIDEIPLNKEGKTDKKIIEHIFNINLSLPVILDRKISKNSITYKLFFQHQANFFKGHFPDFKLVAGVVQIYFAKAFASYHFDIELGEGQWKRVKFSNIIKPDTIVYLKLEKTEKDVKYEYYSNEEKYSSGTFLCENIFKKALEKQHEFI